MKITLKMIEPAAHIKSIEEYYFSVKLAEVARMNAEGKNDQPAVGAPDRMPSQETIEMLMIVPANLMCMPISHIPESLSCEKHMPLVRAFLWCDADT